MNIEQLAEIRARSHRAIHSQGRTIGDIERSAADVPQLLDWLERAIYLLQRPDFVKIPAFLAQFDKFDKVIHKDGDPRNNELDNLVIERAPVPMRPDPGISHEYRRKP